MGIFAAINTRSQQMETTDNIFRKKKSDIRTYIIICLFSCIPVYWASIFYIEAVTNKEDEALAFAATVCFFGFFYVGWYLSEAVTRTSKKVHNSVFGILTLIIAASIIWLFYHVDYTYHRQGINLLLFWLPFIILSVAAGALVKLARVTISNQLQEAKITAAQSQTELRLLQSQLSPHFLFNTLNNLYGLSITQHEKIPALLLKLSDLLRYSVYDAKELFVPLKDELAYINNYIEFEKIRIGERLNLTMSLEHIATHDIKIAPMLLIVFIENAFKHSKNTIEKEVIIEIALKTWGNLILFSVKNSFSDIKDESLVLRKDGGLGLVNVTKRLELLYANEYDLKVENPEGFYSVMLQLKVK
jgi:sensor histidine kinase YesM